MGCAAVACLAGALILYFLNEFDRKLSSSSQLFLFSFGGCHHHTPFFRSGGWLELEEMLNNIDEEISTSREAEIV
jgi:hypothetical protein